jgi:hypothetical protein
MFKRLIFLFLVVLTGCGNPHAPKETNVKTTAPVKSKAPAVKQTANPWTTSSHAPKEGETERRKFVRFVTDGVFSDSTNNNNYLYAEVIVNTANAGILLRELKKSSPAEMFSEPVRIKMTNSLGQELQMTSTRRWNSSGGIMLERNNNDYSQFRIFLMQSKGSVTVEIRDSGTKTYYFNMNADGFSDSFTKL